MRTGAIVHQIMFYTDLISAYQIAQITIFNYKCNI